MTKNKEIRFGIVNPYPGDRIPEEEIINRIQTLVQKNDYNVKFYIFDGKGYWLKDKSKHIEDLDLDFVIDSDHAFCSLPVDCFSYMCMWMPSGFSSKGLYPNYIFNLNSIDDFLDTFRVQNEIDYMKNVCKDTGHLFNKNMHYFSSPGLKESLLKPKKIKDHKLFYSGINAERIKHENGKTIAKAGRHHELFSALDKRKYMEFHGPEVLAGIKPWDGFKQYGGEIPFDGKSLFKRINECGVSLVLHYKAHEYRGLPTTRIFESCVSGAVIIADDFPFIRDTFGDSVFLIDTSKPAEEVVVEIDKVMEWIKDNPEKALEKAEASQKIFLEKLVKNDVIKDICEKHEQRKQEVYDNLHKPLKGKVVDIIVPCKTDNEADADHCVKQILNQAYPNLNAIFVCSEEIGDYINKNHAKSLKEAKAEYKIVKTNLVKWPVATKTTGDLIVEAKSYMKGEFFVVLDSNQIMHEIHISSLANRMIQKKDLLATYSGTYYKFLNERVVKNNRPISVTEIMSFYKYHDVPVVNEYSRMFDVFERKFLKSSIMFKKKVLDYSPENELKFIEGCEHIYFLIKAITKNGLGSFSFTHRVSNGINIRFEKKAAFDIDKELYPYRLNFKEHGRIFQMTSAQLIDCFLSDVNFEQYAVNYTTFIKNETITNNVVNSQYANKITLDEFCRYLICALREKFLKKRKLSKFIAKRFFGKKNWKKYYN